MALRIGIVAHLKYVIGEPFAGGLEMHTHMLATELTRRGHHVVVFAASGSDAGIGVHPLGPATGLMTESKTVEYKTYSDLTIYLQTQYFDIIHNNSLHYAVLDQADRVPAPMVTVLHTPPFAPLAAAVGRAGARGECFMAISQAIARQWAPVVAVDQVVANGVDLRRFAFSAAPEAAPYWVWYGRIVPEKGLHFAIDAARHAGVALRIAGPMADADYFRTEIRPRRGRGVHYLGHLKHRELARLIGGARAFLCTPRWEEPFGLVVAEALACGTPVAAFARGAIPELLDAASGVLARRETAAALATAGLRAQGLARAACRERAETLCDVGAMIAGYEAVYHAVIARRRLQVAA